MHYIIFMNILGCDVGRCVKSDQKSRLQPVKCMNVKFSIRDKTYCFISPTLGRGSKVSTRYVVKNKSGSIMLDKK